MARFDARFSRKFSSLIVACLVQGFLCPSVPWAFPEEGLKEGVGPDSEKNTSAVVDDIVCRGIFNEADSSVNCSAPA